VLGGCDDDDVLSGWTTSRHVNYPTTDIPMNEIQRGRLLPWFRAALRTRLLPWAASCFPAIVEDVWVEDVCVEDAAEGDSKAPNRVKPPQERTRQERTRQERIRRIEPEDLWVYDAFVARYSLLIAYSL
jgi:hypothetical protein